MYREGLFIVDESGSFQDENVQMQFLWSHKLA